ncbi:DUF2750 domain-containing protein [Alteromonas sp. CYL-A6]|uniref:DUF2750 domain-containing protein n=1 Tax=Alteromonas nitratireducens TaxID=3390813 RepID=UPI0034B7078C
MFPNSLTEKLAAPVIAQSLELDSESRYALFLTYIPKSDEVWLLQGDAGFLMMEEAGQTLLPVFPHRDLAQRWCDDKTAAGEQTGESQPVAVPLTAFCDTWLPGLDKNAVALLVFPVVGAENDHLVSAADMLADIRDE